MLSVIARRLALVLPTLLVVSVGVFALSVGLDPERAALGRAGGENAQGSAIQEAIDLLELDEPIHIRYTHWLGDALQGDFGRSYTKLETVSDGNGGSDVVGIPVRDSIAEVLPRTLSLVALSILFIGLLGVPAGLVGGARPGTFADRSVMLGSSLGLAVPNFIAAILLVLLVSVSWDLLPSVGYETVEEAGYWGWFRHLIIPSLALALAPAAVVARQLRASLAECMNMSYVRTAWAKGLPLRRIVIRHALKNASAAPLTAFALTLVSLLGGAVIVENLFGLEGLGGLTVDAVRSNDVPMLQGIVCVFVIFNVAINLIVDIAYGFVDPRVRVQ